MAVAVKRFAAMLAPNGRQQLPQAADPQKPVATAVRRPAAMPALAVSWRPRPVADLQKHARAAKNRAPPGPAAMTSSAHPVAKNRAQVIMIAPVALLSPAMTALRGPGAVRCAVHPAAARAAAAAAAVAEGTLAAAAVRAVVEADANNYSDRVASLVIRNAGALKERTH